MSRAEHDSPKSWMQSTTLRRTPPPSGLVEVGLVAALLALAGAAWALTAVRMDGMDAGPGTELGGLGWFVVVWVTMMAAMMLPSVAPTALSLPRPSVAAFITAYLATWAAAGFIGYVLIEGVRSLNLGFLDWHEAGRYVASGAIAAAALYELTLIKDSCLRRCRGWRPGPAGGLRAGMQYAVVCIGCCWALMAALFALGVMSVGWMVLIAAVIAVEKLLPWRTIASRGAAALLAVLAIAVASAPADVPGLTVPGSPEASHDMEMMHK
jgi:predicted metal-binding membrane protein